MTYEYANEATGRIALVFESAEGFKAVFQDDTSVEIEYYVSLDTALKMAELFTQGVPA